MSSLMGFIPELAGGLFGAVVTLWSQSMKDKAEQHGQLIETLKVHSGIQSDRNKVASSNAGFSWTRRVIALSVTSVVVGAFWYSGTNIVVPREVTEGGSYLFGVIDTTVTNVKYEAIEGSLILPELITSFRVIIGAYFGSSIASRR